MGENLAYLGGLCIAFDAYHASLHGKPAPVLDGLTGDQRVLLATPNHLRESPPQKLFANRPLVTRTAFSK